MGKNKQTINIFESNLLPEAEYSRKSSGRVYVCESSRLCVGLKSQYPGPTQVAMVRGLKYEYSLGLSESCKHIVVMSPSPIGITPLYRHTLTLTPPSAWYTIIKHLHCLCFSLKRSSKNIFNQTLVFWPSFLGAPPGAGVFVLVKVISAVSRPSVISVRIELVPKIRCLVWFNAGIDVECVFALLHFVQQLVQVSRLCRWTKTRHQEVFRQRCCFMDKQHQEVVVIFISHWWNSL